MINIAVMGYGTVGSGVVEVIDTNGERIAQRIGDALNVKYVLDIRDFPEDPIQEKVIHDFETIISDDEIQIVVEVMGGIEPAYTFVKRSLLAGKCVVTSNKALVAKHGAELLSIAKEKNINFLFEASVGGGIPIIRPLNSSLTADEIEEITGILNGTTNYMLTKMFYEGEDYASVLKEAQDMVAPCMLYPDHPLYNVNGVFNAIFVHGNVLGDAMFYGSGAGKLPTASAVVSDVVEAAKNLNRNVMTMWKEEKLRLEDKSSMKRRFFIRMKGNVEEKIEDIRYSFGDVEIVKVDGLDGEFGFVTPIMMEGDYDTRAKSYEDQILHMIRIED